MAQDVIAGGTPPRTAWAFAGKNSPPGEEPVFRNSSFVMSFLASACPEDGNGSHPHIRVAVWAVQRKGAITG